MNKELLEKIRHQLTSEDGLFVTDVKKEAEKMNKDCTWQLNNKELLKEIDLEIEKK